jgi:beta-lactam-binding protein with PASTA domain
MTHSRLRLATATLAVAAALFATGCASDGDSNGDTDTNGPVDVPDVTHLILDTAQGNLLRAGLEVTLVDADGQPVTAEDPLAFTVTDQDPADGTVEPGSAVTLTVEPRG